MGRWVVSLLCSGVWVGVGGCVPPPARGGQGVAGSAVGLGFAGCGGGGGGVTLFAGVSEDLTAGVSPPPEIQAERARTDAIASRLGLKGIVIIISYGIFLIKNMIIIYI
ncbi:hypothetical protein COI34_09130 [Neisseria meningitidis]|nr:hypothetical protein COI34_09130 [Neisseria meningitidis]